MEMCCWTVWAVENLTQKDVLKMSSVGQCWIHVRSCGVWASWNAHTLSRSMRTFRRNRVCFLPRDSVSLSGKLNFFKENQETSLATTRELSTKCSGHCSAWTRKCVADKCVWYKIWHGGTSWKWAGRTTHVQPYGGALAAPTQCHVFKGLPDQEIGACFLPVKVDLHLHSFEFLERNQATSNITCAKVTRDWSCRMQDMSCVRKTGHTD
jgi:hypothetical protein